MNRQMLQAKARANAIKRLQTEFAAEWEAFYREERIAVGLPAEVSSTATADQNRMLRYRVQELEQLLHEATKS